MRRRGGKISPKRKPAGRLLDVEAHSREQAGRRRAQKGSWVSRGRAIRWEPVRVEGRRKLAVSEKPPFAG